MALDKPSQAALQMLLVGTRGPRTVGKLAAALPIDMSVFTPLQAWLEEQNRDRAVGF